MVVFVRSKGHISWRHFKTLRPNTAFATIAVQKPRCARWKHQTQLASVRVRRNTPSHSCCLFPLHLQYIHTYLQQYTWYVSSAQVECTGLTQWARSLPLHSETEFVQALCCKPKTPKSTLNLPTEWHEKIQNNRPGKCYTDSWITRGRNHQERYY